MLPLVVIVVLIGLSMFNNLFYYRGSVGDQTPRIIERVNSDVNPINAQITKEQEKIDCMKFTSYFWCESNQRCLKSGQNESLCKDKKSDGALQSNSKKPCVVTGCSGQVCAEEDIITTCEYIPTYACYKNAKCQRQSNGKCGWTESEELLQCLKANSKIREM
jgi:eight-cysteine-cluster-containing protein